MQGSLPHALLPVHMRCLDLVDSNEPKVEKMGQALWKIPGEEHPFPLPVLSRTEPHLVIKPHPGSKLVGKGSKVGNREETSPTQPSVTARDEIPLIIFTLLAQMAIGTFGVIFMIFLSFINKPIAGQMIFIPFMAVGMIMTFALIVSLFHLRTPKNAWRVLNHLRKSWLSREILFTLGFAGLWVTLAGLTIFRTITSPIQILIAAITLVCGLAALYCMQRVYQLRSMPAWNSFRTLGRVHNFNCGAGMLAYGGAPSGELLPWHPHLDCSCWHPYLFGFDINLIFHPGLENESLRKWRLGLLLAGLAGGMALILWPSGTWIAGWFMVFIIALAEETIGRSLFYLRRNPGI